MIADFVAERPGPARFSLVARKATARYGAIGRRAGGSLAAVQLDGQELCRPGDHALSRCGCSFTAAE